MKTSRYGVLFISYFLIPLGIYAVAIQQVAYIINQGYSKILAAFAFGGALGPWLEGLLYDRTGS